MDAWVETNAPSLRRHEPLTGLEEFICDIASHFTQRMCYALANILECSQTETLFILRKKNPSHLFLQMLCSKGIIDLYDVSKLIYALVEIGRFDVAEDVKHSFERNVRRRHLLPDESLSKCQENVLQDIASAFTPIMCRQLSTVFEFSPSERHQIFRTADPIHLFFRMMCQKGIVGVNDAPKLINALESIGYPFVATKVKYAFTKQYLEHRPLSESLQSQVRDLPSFAFHLSTMLSHSTSRKLATLFQFSVSENDGVEFHTIDFLEFLSRKGLISLTDVSPLTKALRHIGEHKVALKMEMSVETNQNDTVKATETSSLPQAREVAKSLDSVRPLLTYGKIRKLAAEIEPIFFELEGAGGDNSIFLVFLRNEGINSTTDITTLIRFLRIRGNKYVADEVERMLKENQEDDLCSLLTLTELPEKQFAAFLSDISNHLTYDTIQHLSMVFGFSRYELRRVRADKLWFLKTLHDKGIISCTDISLLTRTLRKICRQDVAENIERLYQTNQKEGSNSSEQGAAISAPCSELSTDVSDFSRFLRALSTTLSSSLISELKEPFNLSPSKSERVTNDSFMFLKILHEKDVINATNISSLSNAIINIGRKDVADQMEHVFKENQVENSISSGYFSELSDLPTEDRRLLNIDVWDISDRLEFYFKRNQEVECFSSADFVEVEDKTKFTAESNDQVINDDIQDTGKFQEAENTVFIDEKQNFNFDKTKVTAESQYQTNYDDVHFVEKLQEAEKTEINGEEQNLHVDKEGNAPNSLRATALICNRGVSIVIGDTGVELHIPPNAFHENEKEERIEIRIIPTCLPDESTQCFEDNTTAMVEILPNMLQLRQTAKLILPHCLLLRDTNHCEVTIFQSHHNKGQKPFWEDISEFAQPVLHERFCEFELREFCWIKYTIKGESVMGKKLFLYTIGENYNAEHVTATVGYIPALSGPQAAIEDEFKNAMKGTVYKSNLPGRIIGCWQSFIFRKEPAKALKISIEEIVPDDGWQSGRKPLKKISYSHVELSNEQFRSFTFHRIKSDAPYPLCRFEVSQVDETEIHIDLAQRNNLDLKSQQTVQTDDLCSPTFRGQEISVPNSLILGNEALQVQTTEMMISSSGEVAIRDKRREEIAFHRQISSNDAVQDLSHQLQTLSPFPRRPLQLQLPGPEESLPIFSQLSPSEISKLGSCLDPDHPLDKDWRKLAEMLGFTYGNTCHLKRERSPTEAVVLSACQSGKLKTKDQLIQILEDMGRLDAKNVISN